MRRILSRGWSGWRRRCSLAPAAGALNITGLTRRATGGANTADVTTDTGNNRLADHSARSAPRRRPAAAPDTLGSFSEFHRRATR